MNIPLYNNHMYLGKYVIMHDHIHSIIGIVEDCNDIVVLRPNLKNDKNTCLPFLQKQTVYL